MRILVAITGASGFPLAVRLLQQLEGHERHVVVSESAQKVREYETDLSEDDVKSQCEHYHNVDEIGASVCSGSFVMDAMVVVPCSMNTLARIANGVEHNVITRAVGVNLKQEKKVVLVPRETPMNLVQLKNLVKAKEAGCSIVMPVLGHYAHPKSLQDCEDYVVGKILELLGMQHDAYNRWEGYETERVFEHAGK